MEDDAFVYIRAAHAIVLSPSGKLLVLVGSEWPERPDRSLQPDLVGGSVETGETIEQGLVREVKEEAGIDLDITSLWLAFQNTSPAKYRPGFWHNYYFLARSTSEDVQLSDEHSAYAWVDLGDFVAASWRPSQRMVVDFLHEHGILQQYLKSVE